MSSNRANSLLITMATCLAIVTIGCGGGDDAPPGSDAGTRRDGGTIIADAAMVPDATRPDGGGGAADAGSSADAGEMRDASLPRDAGVTADAGLSHDAGTSASHDAGTSGASDAGLATPDAGGPTADAGAAPDAGGGCTVAAECSDGLSCTLDSCGPGGRCAHTVTIGCLIDGACWAEAQRNPANDCVACFASGSRTAWTDREDGRACVVRAECATGGMCDTGRCRDATPMVCMGGAVCDSSTGTCQIP